MEYLCQLMEENLKKQLAQIVEGQDHFGHKYRALPSTGINHPLALVKISMHPLQPALGVFLLETLVHLLLCLPRNRHIFQLALCGDSTWWWWLRVVVVVICGAGDLCGSGGTCM